MNKTLSNLIELIKENPEDGSCIFRIDVVINVEMYSVFMSYGPGVRIISPHYAACYMREKLQEAAALYGCCEQMEKEGARQQ